MRELGKSVKCLQALKPQTISGQSVDIAGFSIDRKDFDGAVFTTHIGDVAGAPSNYSSVFRIQDSADNATFADVAGYTFTVFSGAVPVPNYAMSGEINVDLRPLNRYVRIVLKNSFKDGSSPNVFVSSAVVLGEPKVYPV